MPDWLQVLVVFFYGSALGSFACLVSFRWPGIMARHPRRVLAGLSYPPSACPCCHHNIRWFENIPVVSYLFLRGKYSVCRSVIPIDHLLIEIIFGFAAVIVWLIVRYWDV